MAKVSLTGVDKFYASTQALSDVSLEIEDGEFAVFVGPSGCGKSTLLRAIAGLERINTGAIHIDSQDVTQVAPSERDVAMVFQTYALYPHMTVQANMEFGMKVNGVAADIRREKVLEAARILQLEDFLGRKPAQLSGGQRQRVAIGRAIVKDPKVFLFDEPLSNLDAKLRIQMRIELEALHKQLGATMIYVTHDQVEAMTMADKIVVLNNGVVEQMGPPLELYKNPCNEFVAGFLGSPSMNFVPVDTQNQQIKLGSVPIPIQEHGNNTATLGIRPEHLEICNADMGLLNVKVQVKESLGGEAYLYTLHEETQTTLVVKTDGEDPRLSEDIIGLQFPPSRVHLFDSDGVALNHRQEASSA